MENLYESPSVKKFIKTPDNPSYKNTKIPLNSRALLCGGSGSGKTNALLNYILLSQDTFDHILICKSEMDEPMYEALQERLGKKGQITFCTLETLPTLVDLRKMMREKEEYLLVFDDVIADLDRKDLIQKVTNYFIMGRKGGLTQMFLSQSYFKVPKTIRCQLTHLLLLRLSSVRDLKAVLMDYELGVTKQQLTEMYRAATCEKFNFLKISTMATNVQDKFARNFTDSFNVKENPDGSVDVSPGNWYHPKLLCHKESPKKRKGPAEDYEDTHKEFRLNREWGG